MRAALKLIRLDLWGNNGRGEHRALVELLGELNPVFAMLSDCPIPIHLFGRRYDVILKRKGSWYEPDECVAGYTDVFYTDGSNTEQGFGQGVYLRNKNEKWGLPLGQYTTVFQAEVYAILKAAA